MSKLSKNIKLFSYTTNTLNSKRVVILIEVELIKEYMNDTYTGVNINTGKTEEETKIDSNKPMSEGNINPPELTEMDDDEVALEQNQDPDA